MMQPVIAAGHALAEALRAENEALTLLDLGRAASLATEKLRASDAFAAAYALAAREGARAAGPERAAAEGLAESLRDLSAENRRLLDRAIALQSRVIETIARAAVPAARPTTYGGLGQRAAPRHAPALAFAARA